MWTITGKGKRILKTVHAGANFNNVLASIRIFVNVVLRKYEIESTGKRVCKKLILCLN